jgi:hypothetical protein
MSCVLKNLPVEERVGPVLQFVNGSKKCMANMSEVTPSTLVFDSDG